MAAGYDTIKLFLPSDECRGTNFMEETPKYLSDLDYHHGYNKGEYGEYKEYNTIKGKLGNLDVRLIYPYGVSVEKSLCKYYLGDNMQTLTRRAVEEAVEKLSDDLHLPMKRAKVNRLDIGTNLITKHPPYMYFLSLGHLSGYIRAPYTPIRNQPNGLKYRTKGGTREACFYDKNLERKDAGEPIPELYLGRNVLRYEIKLLKLPQRERQRIGYDPITAGMLYDEKFYICMNDLWRSVYMEIEKIGNMEEIGNIGKAEFSGRTPTEYINSAVYRCFMADFGSLEGFVEIQDIRRRSGEINSNDKHALLEFAKGIQRKAGQIVKVENTVEELDKLVNDSIKFYR